MSEVRALTIFEQGQMPTHLADLNETGNIVVREQIDQLSFRGKVWRLITGGEEQIIKNIEGDPVQAVPLIFLDYNKERSRAYYSGGYVEGQSSPPVCWSKDSKLPDASVTAKQHATCEGCPKSIKGSKVTDNNQLGVACASNRRSVVIPAVATDMAPLLLKIPQTSMWDADNKDGESKGFYAFDQYMDFLKKKGVQHTATVITKAKFDPRTSYPKLLFGAHGWTTETMAVNIRGWLADKSKLASVLNVSETAAAERQSTAPAPDDYEPPAPAVAEAPAPAPAAAPAPAPAPAPAATKPRPRPAAAPAAAPARAPVTIDANETIDADETMVIPGKTAAAPAAAQAAPPAAAKSSPQTAEAASGLTAMLSGWDDS